MFFNIVQAKQAPQTSASPEKSEWMQSNSDIRHSVFCISASSPKISLSQKWQTTVFATRKPSTIAAARLLALLLVRMDLDLVEVNLEKCNLKQTITDRYGFGVQVRWRTNFLLVIKDADVKYFITYS